MPSSRRRSVCKCPTKNNAVPSVLLGTLQQRSQPGGPRQSCAQARCASGLTCAPASPAMTTEGYWTTRPRLVMHGRTMLYGAWLPPGPGALATAACSAELLRCADVRRVSTFRSRLQTESADVFGASAPRDAYCNNRSSGSDVSRGAAIADSDGLRLAGTRDSPAPGESREV